MGTVFGFFVTCMDSMAAIFIFLEALSSTISMLQDRHLMNSVALTWLCSPRPAVVRQVLLLSRYFYRHQQSIWYGDHRMWESKFIARHVVLIQIKAYVLEGRSELRGRRRKAASGEYRHLSSTEDVLPASDKKMDPKTDYAY